MNSTDLICRCAQPGARVNSSATRSNSFRKRFQLERTRSARGDASDLYAGAAARFADDTTPSSKWWDGTPSHLSIERSLATAAPGSIGLAVGAVTVELDTTHGWIGDLRVALGKLERWKLVLKP